jgi:hypothetical protein
MACTVMPLHGPVLFRPIVYIAISIATKWRSLRDCMSYDANHGNLFADNLIQKMRWSNSGFGKFGYRREERALKELFRD